MWRILTIMTVFGAAACSGNMNVADYNLPAVALQDTGAEIVAPPVAFAYVPLRTYQPDGQGGWQEVAGASCAVSIGPYGGTVTTPVRIRVPDLRPTEVPLVATCTSGSLGGRAVIPSKPGWSGPYGAVSAGMMER
jgi:hypothetical protein